MAKSRDQVYQGRFAPTPSGNLHLGSLITAVASFLDARSRDGLWDVRIDNEDRNREMPGAADSILSTLDIYCFWWDKCTFQSDSLEQYEHYLNNLRVRNLTYDCYCSRKEVLARCIGGEFGSVYDGFCRTKGYIVSRHSERLIVDKDVQFYDSIQGEVSMSLACELGDFIVKRSDGFFAYHLAAVVDDFLQQVSHIVAVSKNKHPFSRFRKVSPSLGVA